MQQVAKLVELQAPLQRHKHEMGLNNCKTKTGNGDETGSLLYCLGLGLEPRFPFLFLFLSAAKLGIPCLDTYTHNMISYLSSDLTQPTADPGRDKKKKLDTRGCSLFRLYGYSYNIK